jgi:glutamine amidotransferase-like uncharacterized protein
MNLVERGTNFINYIEIFGNYTQNDFENYILIPGLVLGITAGSYFFISSGIFSFFPFID